MFIVEYPDIWSYQKNNKNIVLHNPTSLRGKRSPLPSRPSRMLKHINPSPAHSWSCMVSLSTVVTSSHWFSLECDYPNFLFRNLSLRKSWWKDQSLADWHHLSGGFHVFNWSCIFVFYVRISVVFPRGLSWAAHMHLKLLAMGRVCSLA